MLKRGWIAVAFAVSFLVAGPTQAADLAAELCWNKQPFTDIVKCTLSYGGTDQLELHCRQASAAYENAGTGTLWVSDLGGALLKAGVTWIHQGGRFGGCTSLTEVIDFNENLSGMAETTGAGPASCSFSSSSMWTLIACPTAPAEAAPTDAEGAQGEG